MEKHELGYTPANLRAFLKENNISQNTAREYLGLKGRNTFSRYLYDVTNKNHVSMSHTNWLKLLELKVTQFES